MNGDEKNQATVHRSPVTVHPLRTTGYCWLSRCVFAIARASLRVDLASDMQVRMASPCRLSHFALASLYSACALALAAVQSAFAVGESDYLASVAALGVHRPVSYPNQYIGDRKKGILGSLQGPCPAVTRHFPQRVMKLTNVISPPTNSAAPMTATMTTCAGLTFGASGP